VVVVVLAVGGVGGGVTGVPPLLGPVEVDELVDVPVLRGAVAGGVVAVCVVVWVVVVAVLVVLGVEVVDAGVVLALVELPVVEHWLEASDVSVSTPCRRRLRSELATLEGRLATSRPACWAQYRAPPQSPAATSADT
jgi:hypothetical protein